MKAQINIFNFKLLHNLNYLKFKKITELKFQKELNMIPENDVTKIIFLFLPEILKSIKLENEIFSKYICIFLNIFTH